MSDSVRPHRQQPTRLPHPWDSPGKNTGVGCHFLLQCMKGKRESDTTLSDPVDCSLLDSSVHGIFQATVLEWGASAFSSRRLGYAFHMVVSGFQLQQEKANHNATSIFWAPVWKTFVNIPLAKASRWLSPDLRNRHVYVQLSPFAVHLKLSQHCLTGYAPI